MLGALSALGFLVGTVLLFPAVMSGLVGIFLDDVAQAVEARHYALEPPGRALAPLPALRAGLGLALVVVGLNLVALPLYLLLIWLPPISLFIFYGLNGYLIGREYFELVALRHVDRAAARQLHRRHRGAVFLSGCLATFLLTVPLVNLAAPILATAAMVHLFKSWTPRSR
jgi:uncharacterized protein involved in cysteine biosynthesis